MINSSPDCKYLCQPHSSDNPKLFQGSLHGLIADNRHLHPSAGREGKRLVCHLSFTGPEQGKEKRCCTKLNKKWRYS